ncbi:MAG TPA: KH domain-containing protein [bacterium]|jgi:hypothetical protein|nr:KH domain-containing protein [bacterium]HQG58410.1 KH domain-containing protein [bacterium]HQG78973.1 KH domain-containing protein [bacterium]HQK41645.1 KH domain-containing protein [bacterium]
MKEFLEFLIKQITSKPEEVKITENRENDTFIYHIKVSEDDMGIVIGKEGKTIKSLRNLAKAKAIRDNIRIQVLLDESLQDSNEQNL